MKKARWMMIGTLLIAGMAQATPVTLDETTPTKVANWYAYYTNGAPVGIAKGGVGSNTNLTSVSVGMGSTSNAYNMRGGLDFDVSSQNTITNAKLNLYLSSKSSPSYDLAVYAKTVNVTLDTTVALAKAAYSDGAYVDTGLRIATTAANGWFAFDVTSYVTNAVANGGNVSFRFQMLNDTSLTFGIANRYQISSFGTIATAPSLDLYTIPEPATIGMLGLGTLITLLIRRKFIS
jgi:hypothetical protein